MERRKTLIIGAGVSGLSYANFSNQDDYLIVEADHEIGGYCKTVVQDGFVWDYSGHFFHFRRPEIERYLVERMEDDDIRVVNKSAKIRYGDRMVDFPFQKNIHQLPQDEFIDCLHDLFFRETGDATNFRDMLFAKFGRSICEKFLIPYNEKLYACDLAELDADAMGRFFPYADIEEIVRNFRRPDNETYNSTFTYPSGGAIQYVRALKAAVPDERIALNERVMSIDPQRKVATTDRREIQYEHLVSSVPFNRLLRMVGAEHDSALYSSNKVLIFNLGFDKKGWRDVHWVYFPERKYRFYRVGFYDNIFDTDRMSVYVEIGMQTDAQVDEARELESVITGLREAGVVTDHKLVSKHSVTLDPAYVHIGSASQAAVADMRAVLAEDNIHSIGRYGGWKYCAIEDNIVEAHELVKTLEGHDFVF